MKDEAKPLGRLVGVVGRAGSGKDTIGRILTQLEAHSTVPPEAPKRWKQWSFARPIKNFCIDTWAFTEEQVNGTLEQKSAPDPRYPRADGTCLSPREAMQFVGTEIGRKLYPNTWVDAAMRQVKHDRRWDNIVLTDCRFINEAKAIRAAGGEVWRVYRKSADATPATHASESEMDSPEMTKLVTASFRNNSTIEALQQDVLAHLAGRTVMFFDDVEDKAAAVSRIEAELKRRGLWGPYTQIIHDPSCGCAACVLKKAFKDIPYQITHDQPPMAPDEKTIADGIKVPRPVHYHTGDGTQPTVLSCGCRANMVLLTTDLQKVTCVRCKEANIHP